MENIGGKYKCEECGSTDVEQRAWVKLNEPVTSETVGWTMQDLNDYWCVECQEHRDVEFDEDAQTLK